MPKPYRDEDTYGTYDDVYDSVYEDGKRSKGGAPSAKLRDKARNKRALTPKSVAKAAKSEQSNSSFKCCAGSFAFLTVSCFVAAFMLIWQLSYEITQLQSMRNLTQPTPTGSTTTTTVTQPPPFTETLGTTQSLPSIADGNVASALRQLNKVDSQIRDAYEKMSVEFRELQQWTRQTISKTTEQVDSDLCGLEKLLVQWSVPRDALGSLLSIEGWHKAHDNLYYKVFTDQKISYANSKIACAKLGARLASTSVRHLAMKRVRLSSVWIGYDDIRSEGLWTWSDDTRNFYPAEMEWSPGQPDNQFGAEDCGIITQLNGQGKYTLADVECDELFHYICEKDTSSTDVDGC